MKKTQDIINRLFSLRGGKAWLIPALFSFLLFACQKDPKTVPSGTVRLLVTVSHHGIPIPYATIFRKNGTVIFPGQDTTLYDDRYLADENGKFTIEHLGNGEKQIVIYAKGYDPNWDSTHATPVWGYQYGSWTTATGESRDIPMTIPVSE
jgi:hypothetical protein